MNALAWHAVNTDQKCQIPYRAELVLNNATLQFDMRGRCIRGAADTVLIDAGEIKSGKAHSQGQLQQRLLALVLAHDLARDSGEESKTRFLAKGHSVLQQRKACPILLVQLCKPPSRLVFLARKAD